MMFFFSKTVISILKLIFSNIFRYEISSVEIGAGEGRKMSINKFYALIRREGRERRGGRGGKGRGRRHEEREGEWNFQNWFVTYIKPARIRMFFAYCC